MDNDRNGIIVPRNEEITKLAQDVKNAASKALRKQEKTITNISGNDYGNNSLDQLDSPPADVDWIPEKFEQFLIPYPWEFTEKLDAIDDIARKLGTGIKGQFETGEVDAIDTAKGWMQTWNGALADSFVLNYLQPFQSIAENQGRVMVMLHNSLQGMRDIYAEARRSLMETGKNAITALEKADGIPGNGLKAVLTVISTSFAVGSATLGPTPAGPASAIASAVVAGGIAVGSNEIDDKEYPLAADFPDEVLDNLKAALKQLEQDVADKEDQLIAQMEKAAEKLRVYMVAQRIYDFGAPGAGSTPITPRYPEMLNTALFDPEGLSDGFVQLN